VVVVVVVVVECLQILALFVGKLKLSSQEFMEYDRVRWKIDYTTEVKLKQRIVLTYFIIRLYSTVYTVSI